MFLDKGLFEAIDINGTWHTQDTAADLDSLPHQPPGTTSAALRSSGGIGSFDGRSGNFLGRRSTRDTVEAGDTDSSAAAAALLPFFTVGMAAGPAAAASGYPADQASNHSPLDHFHTPAAAAASHQPPPHTPQTAGSAPRPAAGDDGARRPVDSRRASGSARIKRRHVGEASRLLEAATEAERPSANRADTVLHEGLGQFAASKQHGAGSPR